MTDLVASVRWDDDGASAASTYWPALSAWLCESLPGVAADDDGRFVEVGFQTGTDADNFPVDVPPELDAEQPWYWLGFARRTPEVRAAVVLWFAPAAQLGELRELPQWDTGNALGFDFVALGTDKARQMLGEPLLQRVLANFGDHTPVAIERVPA